MSFANFVHHRQNQFGRNYVVFQPHCKMNVIGEQRNPRSCTIPMYKRRQDATACDFEKSTICIPPSLGMNQHYMQSKSILTMTTRDWLRDFDRFVMPYKIV